MSRNFLVCKKKEKSHEPEQRIAIKLFLVAKKKKFTNLNGVANVGNNAGLLICEPRRIWLGARTNGVEETPPTGGGGGCLLLGGALEGGGGWGGHYLIARPPTLPALHCGQGGWDLCQECFMLDFMVGMVENLPKFHGRNGRKLTKVLW